MTSAVESQFQDAEWIVPRMLRASFGAFGNRRERRAAARALSAIDDHLLKDIGISRLEIDFGRLQPPDGKCVSIHQEDHLEPPRGEPRLS